MCFQTQDVKQNASVKRQIETACCKHVNRNFVKTEFNVNTLCLFVFENTVSQLNPNDSLKSFIQLVVYQFEI